MVHFDKIDKEGPPPPTKEDISNHKEVNKYLENKFLTLGLKPRDFFYISIMLQMFLGLKIVPLTCLRKLKIKNLLNHMVVLGDKLQLSRWLGTSQRTSLFQENP